MSTTLNVRIDKKDKYTADKICKDLGLTLSSAVNAFIKAVIRTNGIPFDLNIETPNKETIKALKESKKMDNSKKYKTYKSFAEYRKTMGI